MTETVVLALGPVFLGEALVVDNPLAAHTTGPSQRRLPTGTVTFLLTDIEGSTRLWEQSPEPMRRALVRHDATVENGVMQHHGVVVRPRGEGDSRFAVFQKAGEAVAASA